MLDNGATPGGARRCIMYGMLTRIVVKPGKRTELLECLRWDTEVAKASEPGTWRFDVWEAEQEPGVVYLYEAYKDRAAFDDHAKHDPYRKWDEMADKTMEQVTDMIPLTESLASNADE
jgi:(4S)-4-hydroxy-5-phosphonooxypentane-2,3-dione isomerase